MRAHMTSNSRNPARAVAFALFAAALLAAATIASGQSIDSLIQAQASADREAAAAQERITKLADSAADKAAQYRQALSEADSLTRYNATLRTQVQSQADEVKSIQQQLVDIETTQREIQPLMERMVATLAETVKADVPFLLEERTQRVQRLQEIMPRADVTISEKYRRILEAYQIELEYGRTLDSYQGNLPGQDKVVDFVRVGRISLLYQTGDQEETGYWDQNAKQWVRDDDYREAFIRAVAIAKKRGAPDLIEAPVPAPTEVKS
jgi:hypothetical protein